jgi:1,2-dihydroxy-3-keto-5-methylthiopentene dioxygenase
MATLIIPDKNVALQDPSEIRDYLAARGIWIDQWEAGHPLPDEATQEEILEAYALVLKPFMAKNGYPIADVISVHAQTPNLSELRAKFLREHTHTEDEVRFFVDGQGYFWFNLGKTNSDPSEPVICVKCAAGDLLSVPAQVKHWFDLGPVAFVKTIRIFTDASGWTPHYTESGIDTHYREALVH